MKDEMWIGLRLDCMRYYPLGDYIMENITDNIVYEYKSYDDKSYDDAIMYRIATRMNADFVDYTATVLQYCGYVVVKQTNVVVIYNTINEQ